MAKTTKCDAQKPIKRQNITTFYMSKKSMPSKKARMFNYIFILCSVVNLKGSNSKIATLLERASSDDNLMVINL